MASQDVSTVCFGMAASMGSFLLAAGTKGKRHWDVPLEEVALLIVEKHIDIYRSSSDVRVRSISDLSADLNENHSIRMYQN